MKTLSLTTDRAGERLDAFLARRVSGLSRTRAQRLIEEGRVLIDARSPKASERLPTGLEVTITIPAAARTELLPEDIPLTILYQDGDIIVIDKPPGLTVHPAPGHASGTLVNALLAASPDLRGIAGTLRPGIVHRLDKDTSGLMVVAKNDRAQQSLQKQLKERQVHKTYLALIQGVPSPRQGVIEAPIGRHPKNRKKMAVIAGGREAITRYKVREEIAGGRYALLEVEPVTGRTHQIRVHMAATGHPIIGDATYGKRSDIVGRQFLHAAKLGFLMPLGGREVEFESPLPADLREALDGIRT